MDLLHGQRGSGEEGSSGSRKSKEQYHRHSTEQIQPLESFFKECRCPDENQRRDLSRQLGLDPEQIMLWFQNKRTQETHNERGDSNDLGPENKSIHGEDLRMQDTLKSVVFPECSGSGRGAEDVLTFQKMSKENVQLREEYERSVGPFSGYTGTTIMPPARIMPVSNMPGIVSRGEELRAIHPRDLGQMPWISHNPSSSAYCLSSGIQETDRSLFRNGSIRRGNVIETAISAMDELIKLLNLKDPIWIESSTDGGYSLHRDNYEKHFRKPNYFINTSARFESSRYSGEVAMAASQLIEILSDSNKWKDLLCTVVTKSSTIEILETGSVGGFLHLMHEKVHILSPLVAPRDFYFIRYCRQLSSSTWAMVNVSYDFIKELQDAAPSCSWKLPSGCLIEDKSNGKSTVTWVEHVQLDDNLSIHRLYRNVLFSSQAYGAKRWIATLQRACERFAFSAGLRSSPQNELDGVIDSPEGRISIMKFSHRMVNDFCEALSMPDKLDFSSESNTSGIRISLRNGSGLGQPDGLILSASSSTWLPLSHESLFNLFKDDKKRAQWDVLSAGNPVNSIAHVSTGVHPGNCISVIQPSLTKEYNMLMLQESIVDSLGAMIIYAPVDLPTISSVVNGEDSTKVAILPSGYIICGDGLSNNAAGSGSLLTVAFQILVCYNTESKQMMESVANVNYLLSSTVEKIKVALDCPESELIF